MEYDASGYFLAVFYDIVSDRCHPESYQKLRQLLATMGMLATDKKKFAKFKRRVLKEFREDYDICLIRRGQLD